MEHRTLLGIRHRRLIAPLALSLSAAITLGLPAPARSSDAIPPAAQSSTKVIGALFDWGRELFRKGQVAEALKVFREVARRDPQDDLGHAWTGYLLHRLGKQEVAIDSLKRALELRERSSTYNNLGNAHLEMGDVEAAIKAYRSSIRVVSPDEQTEASDPYYNLGNALFRRGDLEGALKAFMESERLKPRDALTQNNIGFVLEKQSEKDPKSVPLTQALDRYLRAAAMDPENAVFQRNLGLTARKISGMEAVAKRALEKAVELNPRDHSALMNLAEILQQGDDYPAAIVHYEAALLVRPHDFVARYNVGLLFVHLLRRVKDPDVQKTLLGKAKTHLHAALAIDPTDRNSWKVLARADYYAGNYKDAGDTVRRYLRFEPNDAAAYQLLAAIHFQLKDFPMAYALKQFADQLEKFPAVVTPNAPVPIR